MALQRKVLLRDIAEKAGVSISLVSFALNGKEKERRVNPQVAARIQQIAKEMNYRPNVAAKSLRDGRSRTIGVVVSDIANPFFSQIARIIEKTAEKHNYIVQFSSSDENAGRTDTLVQDMVFRGVDGIILVPCEGSEETVRGLVDKEIPHVLLDRHFPEIETDYVGLDNYGASYNAAKHLIEQGFNKIGIVAYSMELSNMKDRILGYRKAMEDSGKGNNVSIQFADHTDMENSCSRAVSEMIGEGTDAIIFASNAIALECMLAIDNGNLNKGRTLGLLAFDDNAAFKFITPSISYIQQPLEEMAEKATEILIGKLESGDTSLQFIETKGLLNIKESSLK